MCSRRMSNLLYSAYSLIYWFDVNGDQFEIDSIAYWEFFAREYLWWIKHTQIYYLYGKNRWINDILI